MTLTIGIDIGSGAVKSVLFRSPDDGSRPQWLAKRCERIRRRDPMTLAREGYDGVLADAGIDAGEVAYTATTGEGENVKFSTGHFYSMTTHARGGVYLDPAARAVVDIGALNGRAISVDERGKVLSYKMTSQCASGSGQFLENIARYLGVAVEEIGPLSKSAKDPEKVSSICAVLAETDVINMVSRGIATPDILKGIHLSMASRIVKLLKVTGSRAAWRCSPAAWRWTPGCWPPSRKRWSTRRSSSRRGRTSTRSTPAPSAPRCGGLTATPG
jgi:benzoyl-CoA reductase subunit D